MRTGDNHVRAANRWQNPQIRWLAASILIGVGFVPQMAAARQACDPFHQQLDVARKERLAHHFEGARKITAAILAQHPDDFRAKYTNALMIIEESGLDRGGVPNKTFDKIKFQAGMTALRQAASSLDSIDAYCARSNNWYGIYNTIGAEFFNAGDLPDSQTNLETAVNHWDTLDPQTKQRLLRNLLTLASAYYGSGEYEKAIYVYSVEGKVGDGPAAQNAIAIIKNAETKFPKR